MVGAFRGALCGVGGGIGVKTCVKVGLFWFRAYKSIVFACFISLFLGFIRLCFAIGLINHVKIMIL